MAVGVTPHMCTDQPMRADATHVTGCWADHTLWARGIAVLAQFPRRCYWSLRHCHYITNCAPEAALIHGHASHMTPDSLFFHTWRFLFIFFFKCASAWGVGARGGTCATVQTGRAARPRRRRCAGTHPAPPRPRAVCRSPRRRPAAVPRRPVVPTRRPEAARWRRAPAPAQLLPYASFETEHFDMYTRSIFKIYIFLNMYRYRPCIQTIRSISHRMTVHTRLRFCSCRSQHT